MHSAEALLEPVIDLGSTSVLGTGYNVAQLAVGGAAILGIAIGVRYLYNKALGK